MATAAASASPVAPPWHCLIHLRLQERDRHEKHYDPIFQSYANLAAQARLLKQRNRSLLTASSAVPVQPHPKHEAPSSSTSTTVPPSAPATPAPAATTASNPVHLAYITSLETQLTTHRDEIATLYKTQGQNAQRLLLMNESLREREEESRRRADEIAKLSHEHDKLKRAAEDLANVVGEKEKGIQILQDELVALSLELSQIESRNEDLKKDNASLLQRWLDRMNEEADKMNEGTMWLEEVRKRRQEGQPASTSPSTAEGDRIAVPEPNLATEH